MKVEFSGSFVRDLKRLRDKALQNRIREMIELVEQADRIETITDLKKLKGEGRYYRIRLGDFRAGLMLEGETIVFVRFLHRKDIYRYFP
ncbi:MAG: type II toxin-antitoxin system RelE family toxin [Anaerolineales bacterium]